MTVTIATSHITRAAFTAALALRFPNLVLIVDSVSYDRGDDYDFYDRGSYGKVPAPAPHGERIEGADALASWFHENVTQDESNREERSNLRRRILATEGDLAAVASFVVAVANEYNDWGHFTLETEKQNRNRRSEHQLKALEPLAREIASKYGVQVGTNDFVTALHKELARQEVGESSRREGLREDGLCIGYGATFEQWQDEINSPTYAVSEARAVMEWLREFHPLLCLTWDAQHPNGLTDAEIWEGGEE